MHELHLTRDFLRALNDETRQPGDLFSLVITHLFELCPICENEFQAFKAELAQGGGEIYDPAFQRTRASLRIVGNRVQREKKNAERDLQAILSSPSKEREERLLEMSADRRSVALAALLIDSSFAKFQGAADEALHLALLGRTVLQHLEVSDLVIELYARALSCVANATRIRGNLATASDHFESARFLLRSIGGGDRRTRSEMDWLEGILRRDQRRFDEAIRLQKRAATTFAMEDDALWAAKVFVSLALTYRDTCQAFDAIEAIEEALKMLERSPNQDLMMSASHALVLCLCDGGYFELAEEKLNDNRPLYEACGDPLSLLRQSWLEGKIARGLGKLEKAEAFFQSVQDGFRSRNLAYDTALVSLEMASMYLQQGRAREVQTLAVEMVEVFERLEVHREALAALMLFEDAAKLQQVTVSWVESLSRYLMQAQRDPTLTFQAAS